MTYLMDTTFDGTFNFVYFNDDGRFLPALQYLKAHRLPYKLESSINPIDLAMFDDDDVDDEDDEDGSESDDSEDSSSEDDDF